MDQMVNASEFSVVTTARMWEVLMDIVTRLKDPRLFVVATPAASLLKSGGSVGSFSAYKGANPSLVLRDLSAASTAVEFSFITYARYYRDFVARRDRDGCFCGSKSIFQKIDLLPKQSFCHREI